MRIYIGLLVNFLTLLSFSQVQIDNASYFKVSANTNVVIDNGGLQNNGTVSLNNTSNIRFHGNGTVQTIEGNNNIIFGILTIDKNTNDVQLARNIEVSNKIEMTNGDLDLKNQTIELGASATLENETNTKRIKSTDVGGNDGLGTGTIFTIRNNPVGNIANLGLTVDLADEGSTTITRGHERQQGTGTYVINYSVFRYFTLSNIVLGGGGEDVTFVDCFTDELNGHNSNDLVMYQWYEENYSGLEYWHPLNTTGSSVSITETLDNNTLSYIKVTLGSKNTPLPIMLTKFDANNYHKESVLLNWQTSTEINNDFFTLEKSSDAENWKIIAIVDGAGNSNNTINYQSIDENIIISKNYYRLKQTDFNGTFSYSDIRVVEFVEENKTDFLSDIVIYPVPTHQTLNVKNIQSEYVDYSIFSVTGVLLKEKLNVEVDNAKITIDVGSLISGTYFIKLLTNHNSKLKSFIKY